MDSGNGRRVPCPLCEGRGYFYRSALIEKLSDRHRTEGLAALLESLKVKANQSEQINEVKVADRCWDFSREVRSWPSERILWRRSPKE